MSGDSAEPVDGAAGACGDEILAGDDGAQAGEERMLAGGDGNRATGAAGESASVTTGTVRTNDIETYYERRGEGPPVVFVHGAIVHLGAWGPQLAALADEYETVAYDVRGHGRTGGSARDGYSIELLADDLGAVIDGLDLDRPVLCGHSMGGCVAQVYAARHPDEISGLVLADTFTSDLSTLGERLQMAVLEATIPPVRLLGYERVEAAMVWLRERLQPGVSGEYGKVETLREDAPRMETAEFEKIVRAVTGFRTTPVDLSAITVPTLVLYGENEPSFVVRHAGLFAAAISDVTVEVVPGAGHAANLDDPAFVTGAVRRLLERAFDDRDA